LAAAPQAQRRRRQVAVTQATIACAVRVAKEAGPEWRVEIDGDKVTLMQGLPPPTAAPKFARGLDVVP
jgi:hypothetical protein